MKFLKSITESKKHCFLIMNYLSHSDYGRVPRSIYQYFSLNTNLRAEFAKLEARSLRWKQQIVVIFTPGTMKSIQVKKKFSLQGFFLGGGGRSHVRGDKIAPPTELLRVFPQE